MDTGQTIHVTNTKKGDSGHEKKENSQIEKENRYPGDIRSPELNGLREGK